MMYGIRSDCKNLSRCGENSYYKCRNYCHGFSFINCYIRNRIYYKAMKLGDELFPDDIVDYINSEKKLNNMTINEKRKALLEIYTSCNFYLTEIGSKEYFQEVR